MRARIEDGVVFLHKDDVPPYKKGGSTVRNSYFWALRSIAGRAYRGQAWEFESDVWLALQRMLLSFGESRYLGTQELVLEFPVDQAIPPELRAVSTWQDPVAESL